MENKSQKKKRKTEEGKHESVSDFENQTTKKEKRSVCVQNKLVAMQPRHVVSSHISLNLYLTVAAAAPALSFSFMILFLNRLTGSNN